MNICGSSFANYQKGIGSTDILWALQMISVHDFATDAVRQYCIKMLSFYGKTKIVTNICSNILGLIM